MATLNACITSSRNCAAGTSTVGNEPAVTTGRSPFNYPAGLALAPNGDCIIANSFGHSICRQAPTGMVSTIAGAGWPGLCDGSTHEALFNYPEALAIDKAGIVYVADCDNHAIRVIAPTGEVTTLAGSGRPGFKDGGGTEAAFDAPRGVALDTSGNLVVADTLCVRCVSSDGEVRTLAHASNWVDECGSIQPGFFGGIAIEENGDMLLTDTSLHAVLIVERDGRAFVLAGGNGPGFSDGRGRSASFDKPRGLAVDRSGRVFVADSNNNSVRVLLVNGKVETLMGEDLGIKGGLSHPAGVAIGRNGYLYVSDQFNNCVYRVLV